MTEQEAQRREAVLRMLIAAMSLAWMGWTMTPEHQRRLAMMRLAAASRRVLAAAARSAGHDAMGVELASGREAYGLPWLLSRGRDAAGRAYDRMREAS